MLICFTPLQNLTKYTDCFWIHLPCPLYFLNDLRLALFIVDVIGFRPMDVPFFVGAYAELL